MMEKGIVVVGTSLGGLRALSVLLGGLGLDFRLPVAVVQHRSVEPDSPLVKLLQRQTLLRVAEVDDKTRIETGWVFIAPPDYHLLVGVEQFSLSTEEPVSHARPSIDVLFESAASSFGSRVVAVVLTGANADGARGAALVKRAGGRVVAQDPAEAESAAMPLAVTSQGIADAILPLAGIAPYLMQWA